MLLHKDVTRDKIKTTRGWLCCPVCGQRLHKLLPETEAKNFVIYCRKCGRESVVNIAPAPVP